jgi:RIO-like serine/threonine protein kinase
LYEEVAYLAYHFNWSRVDILALDHFERRRWVEQVANINRRLNDESSCREAKM